MTNERRGDTKSASYTARLSSLEGRWIKRFLNPINPYRWNIRRLANGKTLDVGCGIGRNLRYLARPDSVGVDHNIDSIAIVRELGFEGFTPEKFHEIFSGQAVFDTILISHVLEHLDLEDAKNLINSYLPYLKKDGRVVVICPQEVGFRSDKTHVTYLTSNSIAELCCSLDLKPVVCRSFPLPSVFGKIYVYNEHIVVAILS